MGAARRAPASVGARETCAWRLGWGGVGCARGRVAAPDGGGIARHVAIDEGRCGCVRACVEIDMQLGSMACKDARGYCVSKGSRSLHPQLGRARRCQVEGGQACTAAQLWRTIAQRRRSWCRSQRVYAQRHTYCQGGSRARAAHGPAKGGYSSLSNAASVRVAARPSGALAA